MGDLYLNTKLQIWHNARWQGALRLGYKFATSTRQGLARFTDAPGYYLDASVGMILKKTTVFQLRTSLMAGLYIWQTNSDEQFQNDAFMGGIGIIGDIRHWSFQQELRGYAGYRSNGDKPLLWQSAIERTFRSFMLIARFKKGFFDSHLRHD